ncbi:MAG: hypothetical protein AB7S48_12785 [Bacteroidales bacterium]
MGKSLVNKKKWIVLFAITTFVTIFSLTPKAFFQDENKFSGDILIYPAELNSIVNKDLSKEDEEFIKKFTTFWASDTISEENKKNIIEISNLMLPILPESKAMILTYIKLIDKFFKDNYANKNYVAWNSAYTQLLKSSEITVADIGNFFRFTRAVVDNSILKQTNTFLWKAGIHPSYIFDFKDKLTVKLNNVSLVCQYGNDSIFIKGTSGVFDPSNGSWLGNGGKVTWVRSGYPDDEIFAELKKYTLDLNKNSYTIDSVYFTNKDYFKESSLGKITDRLIKDYHPNTIQFPEFESYGKWFQIKNLFKNVDYEGGYIMQGSKLIGKGSADKLATVSISRDGKEFLRVEGNILIFQRSILNTEKASILFKFPNDSIYHSGLYFNYNNKNRTVTIAPTDKLTTQSPFISTYHKLSIWSDQLTWKIDEDKIQFGAATGATMGRASFESDNFFNETYFDDMMGPSDQHPLFAIWNYSVKKKTKTFLAADLAVYLRKPVEQVKIEMMRIAKNGYILYDFGSDEVQITQKLRYTILARFQKIDYDVIRFSSICNGNTPNAELDLKTMDMHIRGVENISVSDSQKVYINPQNKEILMKKNRNFQFGGFVQAGLFKFHGNNFTFDYDQFKIDLVDADLLELDYQTNDRNNYGQRILQSVQNTMEKINGNILIDKPNNKSGLISNPIYPIFNSTGLSFVYYDDTSIHGGIYKRDSFYFQIQPFTYENLDNFESVDLNFKGILYSGNILAPIEETLVLRPDNSLGFIKQTPPEGLALYRGKGFAYNRVDLSNNGLVISGDIKYISSTTSSDSMYLFPDSMITKSNSFNIDKRISGIQYPKLIGEKHKIKWLPKRDKFFVKQGERPFVMYDSLAKLMGNLLLEPIGLTGNGDIALDNASLKSSHYEFNADDFNSPKADLKLYKPKTEDLALSTNDVKSKIDFKNQKGEFSKTNKSVYAKLNALNYEAHLDRFGWNMSNNNLAFLTTMQQEAVKDGEFTITRMADKDTIPSGSLFYSVKADEDSLYYFSPKSTYSLETAELKSDSVNYILVADAAIYPKDKKVKVDPTNRMNRFPSATINASISNKYHKIYNSALSISSRRKYKGNGYYDYVDENDSVQTITLTNVENDAFLNTHAEGKLTEPDSFKLSPHFAFIGDVSLYAPEKNLEFKGGALAMYDCPNTKAQWLKFESRIDSKKVLIPVNEKPQNLNLHYLINGSVIAEDSLKLYGGFMRMRKDYADKPIVLAQGYMSFNNNNRRFTIAESYKLENPDTSGNSVSLQKDYCMTFGEGRVQLPINLGQIKLDNIGSLIHKLEENDLGLDMVMKLDFLFNQKSLEAMAAEINGAITLKKVDLSRKIYRKALYEWIDSSEIHATLNQLNLFGAFNQTPKGYNATMVLNDIKLKWDPVRKSFVSKGQIGIGSLGNVQVNKFVNGYLEIFKKRSGDLMTLYIHLGDDRYYVFTYTKSVMQVSSSNQDFVLPIKEQKSSEQRIKVKPGQPEYRFLLGTKKDLDQARQRYNQLMFGIETKPDVDKSEEKVKEENSAKTEQVEEEKND